MTTLNDIWLRGQAAQSSMMQLAAYNAAFMGTAQLQTLRMALNAPQSFWRVLAAAEGTVEPSKTAFKTPGKAPAKSPAKTAAKSPVARKRRAKAA